jgi:hypothetical protein
MNDHIDNHLDTRSAPHAAAPPDLLAVAYHDAARAHVQAIKTGTPLEILHAYRGVLAAEIALLRDCPGAYDQATAATLTCALEDVDRDLAQRPTRPLRAVAPVAADPADPTASPTLAVDVPVSAQAVFDAIVSGLEGGIQYWGQLVAFQPEHRGDLRLVCDVVERDTGERLVLQDRWADALRLMAARYPRKFVEVVEGSGDQTTGDVLIQLAAFGELRYG